MANISVTSSINALLISRTALAYKAALETLGVRSAGFVNTGTTVGCVPVLLIGNKLPVVDGSNLTGITKSMVELANVDNTADAAKPVSTTQQTALDLKAPLASPSFTGVPLAPTASSGTNNGQIATAQFVQSAIQGVVGAAPAALDTLNELAEALNNDASYASTITNALSLKAPLASPTFSGTTTGTFSGPLTGNVTGSATSFTGSLLGDVTGTQSATVISAATVTGKALTGYVSGAGTLNAADTILTALNKLNGNVALKANSASPTFTGTVNGLTSTAVGLGNVTNESKATMFTNPTFTGTATGTFSGNVTGNVSGSAANFTGALSGQVTGNQSNTAIAATTVTGKSLTNYASATGAISATDTILGAIGKLNGNTALKISSDTTGVTATAITNIIQVTQSVYNNILSPNATTLYVIVG